MLFLLLVLLARVGCGQTCAGNLASPSCYVTGLGLYAMNLTGQPPTPAFEMGMLGSIAIDGTPSGPCQNVNIGETVTPNVFDSLGESFSVEAWIAHPNPADGQYKPFLSRHPGNGQGNQASEFTFQIQKNGNINFFTGCGNYWQYGFNVGLLNPRFPLWRNFTMAPNTWTHVAATVQWDYPQFGINFGLVTLYVNGELIDQKPWGSNDAIGACTGRRRSRAPGQPVRIGYYDNSDAGVQTFGGSIDEIRIWNKTLTQAQIQQHMHGLFFDKTDMVAYFGFSEGAEGFFPDQNRANLQHSFNQANAMFPCVSGQFVNNSFSPLPWQLSGLKIHNAPITTTVGSGSASGQLLGIDFTTSNFTNTFQYVITGMLFTTDAQVFYYKDNTTRTLLQPPFPVLVPPVQLEYLPGKRAGIDVVLYEARSPTTGLLEPGYQPGFNSTTDCCHGPTKMTFRVLCPPNAPPDRCGVCGGNNTTFCPCFCNQAGQVLNQCGICGATPQSPDCRGCDCIPFSNTKLDCCGICGGSNVNSSTIVDCPNNLCGPGPGCPRVDACGVCGGNNSTCMCAVYDGFTTQRMDYVLLTSSLNSILQEIATVESGIAAIDNKLPSTPASVSDLALAAEILALNQFCEQSAAMSASLAQLLQSLNAFNGGPCGSVPLYPCTETDLYNL